MNKDDKELVSRIVHDIYKLVDKARADERERCVQAVCKASFTSGHVTDKGTIMLPKDKAIEAIKAE